MCFIHIICLFVYFSRLSRSYRNQIRSRSHLAAKSQPYPRVKVDFAITADSLLSVAPDRPIERDEEATKLVFHSPEEEISLAPACWLWDYLRYLRNSSFLSTFQDSWILF